MGCSHGVIANAIFLPQQIGSVRYQRKYSHDAILTMALNTMQSISCEKYIAVAIALCEQSISTKRRSRHGNVQWLFFKLDIDTQYSDSIDHACHVHVRGIEPIYSNPEENAW